MAHCDDLGEDRDGGLVGCGAAQVQAERGTQAREVLLADTAGQEVLTTNA